MRVDMRWYKTVAFAVVLAGLALGIGHAPLADNHSAEASPADHTTVVFVPGVCLPFGETCTVHRDYHAFDDIRNHLSAVFSSLRFKCFSYEPGGGDCGDAPYPGTSTWQSLMVSASRLNTQLQTWRAEAQAAGDPDPRFLIIAHSLGGAVAGLWAATSLDFDLVGRTDHIVTLDSPVKGSTWDELGHELLAGLGIPDWVIGPILEVLGQREIEQFIYSDVVADLQPDSVAYSIRHAVNRVNVVNLADTRDLVVPFYDATLPGAFRTRVAEFGNTEGCNPTIGPIDIRVGPITIFHLDRTTIYLRHCEVLHSSETFAEITSLLSAPVNPVDPQPPVAPPPSISVVVSPPPNPAGWNNTSVSIDWTVTDATSTDGCSDQTISYQTSGSTFTCTATNSGGTRSRSVTIRLDSIAPSIVGSRTPGPNAFGWNNTDVTGHFDCSDERSGVAFCSPDQTLSGEGRNQSITGVALDVAGNSSSTVITGINIDKTPPVTTATLDPPTPNGKRGWYISDVSVCLSATDPQLSDGSPGSGVDYTKYRANGGPWQDYGGCFVVSTEGWNQVDFYSEDIADNIEAQQNVRIKLDKTNPDIGITEGILDGLHWDQVHLERGILTNTDTLALSGDATDNLCFWEVRAVDADSGQTLASQQPDGANTPDWPPPYPPNSLGYGLSVPLHVGINNIDVVAEDCAGWEDDIRIQVVYVIPGPYDPRSKGFWYNAVKTSKYSDAEFQTLMDYTNVVSDVFGPDARNIYGLVTADNYRTILKSKSSDMEELQKAQLLGSWLNLVSGRVAVLTPADLSPVAGWPQVVDNTGGSPLTFAMNVPMEVEEIDQTGTATRAVYEIAKNLLDAFNNRMIIP